MEYEVFVVYVVALSIDPSGKLHLLKRAQIAHLKVDKTHTEIPNKYADFADIFFPKLDTELLKHMEINDYTIELVDD